MEEKMEQVSFEETLDLFKRIKKLYQTVEKVMSNVTGSAEIMPEKVEEKEQPAEETEGEEGETKVGGGWESEIPINTIFTYAD